MENSKINEAMQYLDPQLIQEAAHPVSCRKHRIRPLFLAACLTLLIVVPVVGITGNLLVEHYFGESIPKNLENQELDAFFQANSSDKVPVSALSQELLDTAAAQAEKTGYYGFETWDEAEAFLGINILDSDRMLSGYSIPVTDVDGRQILHAPCHLTLLRNDDGVLIALNLQYFFQNSAGELISLNASAVTDQNPHGNNSSIGISNEGASVLQQNSETYLTKSGYQTSIISTEYSNDQGWEIDGWVQKKGFMLRFSLSAQDEETGKHTIWELLDSIE